MLSYNARGTQLLCRAAEKEASTRFLMPFPKKIHAHGRKIPCPWRNNAVLWLLNAILLATENAETLHVTDFTHGREQPRGTVESGQSLSPGARVTLKRHVFSRLRFAVSPFCRTFALTL